mmetsp:Transcript_15533/g.49080  ORF Transcript_15533/g.49080 Transcript_15533/m.49080 type:complete len:234 (+) Transcript_15533:917-1618(+)
MPRRRRAPSMSLRKERVEAALPRVSKRTPEAVMAVKSTICETNNPSMAMSLQPELPFSHIRTVLKVNRCSKPPTKTTSTPSQIQPCVRLMKETTTLRLVARAAPNGFRAACRCRCKRRSCARRARHSASGSSGGGAPFAPWTKARSGSESRTRSAMAIAGSSPASSSPSGACCATPAADAGDSCPGSAPLGSGVASSLRVAATGEWPPPRLNSPPNASTRTCGSWIASAGGPL